MYKGKERQAGDLDWMAGDRQFNEIQHKASTGFDPTVYLPCATLCLCVVTTR
ncbi:hypothetical protein [Budvicia aquatica]|uniref:Uncharacterized protein n=1 Tax=Budvicia aquatica TaxID=82979 RepID=A0A484ZNN9_9GAMM|nr:hypothetical protein [Budvicia aquatica]VFS50237.1 Uncharacterised protein [Budvicia aquatica]